MKRNGTKIHIGFSSHQDVDIVLDTISHRFDSLLVHCKNVLKVHQHFREAYRAYMVGRGKCRQKDGKISGRFPITTFDSAIERIGIAYEISFKFCDTLVYADISGIHMRIHVLQTDIWVIDLVEVIKSILDVKNIEIRKQEYNEHIPLFYADLERRLNEGDFEGGEEMSRDYACLTLDYPTGLYNYQTCMDRAKDEGFDI
jgi:hypothetical protein